MEKVGADNHYDLVDVRVETLIGPALDYALAVAANKQDACIGWRERGTVAYVIINGVGAYPVSTDWGLIGPLMDEYNVWPTPTNWNSEPCKFVAYVGGSEGPMYGPTAPVAAARCIVNRISGPVAKIPSILFDAAN